MKTFARKTWFLACFSLVLFAAMWGARAAEDDVPLSRIAFGSCANQSIPQPIWDAVVGTKPQRFVFLGDNIYADTEDMDIMRAKSLKGETGVAPCIMVAENEQAGHHLVIVQRGCENRC